MEEGSPWHIDLMFFRNGFTVQCPICKEPVCKDSWVVAVAYSGSRYVICREELHVCCNFEMMVVKTLPSEEKARELGNMAIDIIKSNGSTDTINLVELESLPKPSLN